jgi:CYTH domain-containing protein
MSENNIRENGEIELERTFLLKKLPEDFDSFKSEEILDIYFPENVFHPILRLRKKGNFLTLTKKSPIENDSSIQEEQTIILSEKEYKEFSQVPGKRLRKIRYYYPVDDYLAEIDLFLEDLEGLALVDFEFDSIEEKEKFLMPDFCLADVTQEESIAGGFLAGKRYADVEPFLEKYGYKKIVRK